MSRNPVNPIPTNPIPMHPTPMHPTPMNPTPMAPPPPPSLVLAGCGTVGGGLLRLIRQGQGSDDAVRSVLVRNLERVRTEALPEGRGTTDPDALPIHGPTTVVETLGGEDTAHTLALRTLGQGGTFITANKALIARHGADLEALACERGGRLAFEAAVGGGMPVVRLLRDLPPEAGVLRVEGILNGTSNFLLDRLTRGAKWDDALEEARALGFAEADPTRDLDGRDALDKVRILGWLAFGTRPEAIPGWRMGLLPDPALVAAEAVRAGGVARLLAWVGPTGREDPRVQATVSPCVVLPGSPWGEVSGADNRAEIRTIHSGTLSVGGPGAGGEATATAILTDLRDPGRPSEGRRTSRPGAKRPALERDALESGDPPTGDPDPGVWHLSVPGRVPTQPRGPVEDRVERVLDQAGVERGRLAREDGRWRVRIQAADPSRVVLVRRLLGTEGFEPVLLREVRPPQGG